MGGAEEFGVIVSLVGLLVIIGILAFIFLGIIFLIFRGIHSRKTDVSDKATEKDLQQLHQLAQRLENRIESLETILLATVKPPKKDK